MPPCGIAMSAEAALIERPRHLYLTGGLILASDVPLAGHTPAPPDAVPDIFIAQGPVPDQLDGATLGGPTWYYDNQRILLLVPTIGRFLIGAGTTIDYAADPAATPADIAAFVGGSILGILLQQRGIVLLHASAIDVGGQAVLFSGVSGAGKSTLAAALGQRGYRQFADDQCVLSIDQAGRPWIASDGAAPRLWADTIDALALGEKRGIALRPTIEKYHLTPSPAPQASLPFGAIYFLLEDRPPHVAGISQLSLPDTAKTLFAEAYRPQLAIALDQRMAYFRASTAIAQTGRRAYRLARPRQFDALPEVIDWLEAHWRDIGLTSGP